MLLVLIIIISGTGTISDAVTISGKVVISCVVSVSSHVCPCTLQDLTSDSGASFSCHSWRQRGKSVSFNFTELAMLWYSHRILNFMIVCTRLRISVPELEILSPAIMIIVIIIIIWSGIFRLSRRGNQSSVITYYMKWHFPSVKER